MAHNSHFRIKYARFWLDDTNGAVIGLDSKWHALGVGDNNGQLQPQVLGVHFSDERIFQRMLFSSGDRDVVAGSSEVVDILGCFSRRINSP